MQSGCAHSQDGPPAHGGPEEVVVLGHRLAGGDTDTHAQAFVGPGTLLERALDVCRGPDRA